MKKEDLIALGLTDEQAEKVLSANAEHLKGFIPKARFDEVNNAKKQLEKDISDRDNQLETLKNSAGDAEALKTTIAQLQVDNKVAAENYQTELAKLKLAGAIDAALLGADVINIKAVKALLDVSKIKLDGETLTGINDQIETLKSAEDSKMLFKSETKAGFSGVKPGEGNAGTHNSGGQPKSLANAIMAKLTGNNE